MALGPSKTWSHLRFLRRRGVDKTSKRLKIRFFTSQWGPWIEQVHTSPQHLHSLGRLWLLRTWKWSKEVRKETKVRIRFKTHNQGQQHRLPRPSWVRGWHLPYELEKYRVLDRHRCPQRHVCSLQSSLPWTRALRNESNKPRPLHLVSKFTRIFLGSQ